MSKAHRRGFWAILIVVSVWFGTWRRETTELLRVEIEFDESLAANQSQVIGEFTSVPTGSSAEVARLVLGMARLQQGGNSAAPVSAAEIMGTKVILKSRARVDILMFVALEVWKTRLPPAVLVLVPREDLAILADIAIDAPIAESPGSDVYVLKLGPVALRGNELKLGLPGSFGG